MRLDGARKDLEALDSDIGTFLRERIYAVLRENDPNTGERLLGIRIANPPADWGRRAGHVINDLRSSLDYLVYQLAWLDSGTIQNGTQFPICDTPQAFAAEQVRELSNPDKHRHLNTVESDHWPPVPLVGNAITLNRQHKPYRLMNEAKRFGIGYPLTSQFNVQMNISTGVAFSDGSPVVETLQVLESGVRRVVDSFQPEF